jgi:tetratricopeptide (TPR) repeat protein
MMAAGGSGTRLARIGVVLVALPAIAWLALSYSGTRVIHDAQVVASAPHPTPAQIDAAIAEVRGSRPLDPSRTEALSYAAVLEIRAGRLDKARALYEQIVRREPETAEAWLLLAQLSQKSDPARAAAARAQVHRLDPLLAKHR